MYDTFAAAKQLRSGIDEIARVLGPPLHRTMTHSSGTPIQHRSIWKCGCVVCFIDENIDDAEAGLQWDSCGDHRQIGESLSLPPSASKQSNTIAPSSL